MSSIGYRSLLYRVSQNLRDVSKINQIIYASSSEGLISENSESFNVRVNPGDNTAVTVMKFFSDLAESDNLGLDNLETLRDLLTEVNEWSLVDEVDKFERQRKDFSTLLETIIPKLDELDNLEQLLALCEDHISDDAKDEIKDVQSLFKELQKKNRLGFKRLTIVRTILNKTGQQELLDLLTEFEKKWKEEEKAKRRKDRASDAVNAVIVAPATAVCSTVKHTWEQFIGAAVKILCKFSTVSGIPLLVGTGIILQQGARASLREFVDAFKEAVLPAATYLRTLSESSLCFTVQAENKQALKVLWQRYQEGTLQRNLQEFLVTDNIRQLAGGKEVILSAYIDEQDYNNAWLSISIAEQQVLQKENQEISPKRTRRNSDSSLHARSIEKLVVLAPREEEIKLYKERTKEIEEEIEKLEPRVEHASSWKQEIEIQKGPGLKRFVPISDWQIEELKAREITDNKRPTKRRRRNSDSDLYCKSKDEEIREKEKKQEDLLGDEKCSFVQRYLLQVHDTRSVVTSAGESGFVPEETASEVGHMEDMTDSTPRLSHVRENVIDELQERLAEDRNAFRRVLQTFGITDASSLSTFVSRDIFRFFPDTPVTILKHVFEALQLYDLLELLEKPMKPRESLQLALTLEQIKNLSGVADCPITYHSCGAVLIIGDDENEYYASGLKTFFTELDNKSDVTIIQRSSELSHEQDVRKLWRLKEEIDSIKMEIKGREQLFGGETQRQTEFWKSLLQSKMDTLERLNLRIKEYKELPENVSSVINRWVHRQDGFSFFAVFVIDCYKCDVFLGPIIKELMSAIPNKLKFVVCPSWYAPPPGPEAFLGVYTSWYRPPAAWRLLLKILNMRWQTLDLKSMMSELKRSLSSEMSTDLEIKDTLSSFHRFKQKEG